MDKPTDSVLSKWWSAKGGAPSLLLTILVMFVVGCEDDTTGPGRGTSPWTEVALPSGLDDAGILRVDATNGRALGYRDASNPQPFLLELDGDDWNLVDPAWPSSVFVFDLAAGADGRGIAVGGSPSGGVFVNAQRPDWTDTSILSGSGFLRAVVRRADGSFVAVGSTSSAALRASGTLDGAWTRATVPLPGSPNEKALVSVVESGGNLYACGFDDGGEGTSEQPYRLMMRDTGSGFELMSGPCTSCSNFEFETLAVTSVGGVLLGGAITDWSAANPADQMIAFLALYSPISEQWTEIPLPDASALDRVNDILVASDGSIYLACGESGRASLVHFPPNGPAVVEWTAPAGASLFAVSEGADGTIFAAGADDGATSTRPIFLRRSPSP